MVHKNIGAVPPHGMRQPVDEALLAATGAGCATVGAHLREHRNRAALTEAMRLVQDANRYVSETEPWKLKGDPDRLATVLHTTTQAVLDLNTMLAPFLPFSAQKVHETFGGSGTFSPMPRIEEVTDLDDASRRYPVITGDYRLGETVRPWASSAAVPGAPVGAPTPVFTKLDDSIVEDEIARAQQA